MGPLFQATRLFLAAVALGASTLASAQLLPPRGGPMAPGATVSVDPHEQLRFFEGRWEIVGLPGGRQFEETCDWLSAERKHLVCHARTTAPAGAGTAASVEPSMSVLSYRPGDATYIYHGFTPDGVVHTMQGRRTGDAWQFAGEQGSGASSRRTRMTIVPGGERSFILQQETAIGNGPWQRETDVRYVPALKR